MPIITFIFALVNPIIAIPFLLIALQRDKANLKKYSISVALMFAMYGYGISSKGEGDLERYHSWIESYYATPLKDLFAKNTDLLYSKDVLFRLIHLSEDVNFLSFVVGLFLYWMVFYVLFDVISRNYTEIRKKDIVYWLIIICGVVPTEGVIGNTRCVFSFVMIVFAYYRIVVERKKIYISIALVLIAMTLHGAAAALVLAAMISFFIKEMKPIYLAVALFVPTLISIVYNLFSGVLVNFPIIKLFILMIKRAYAYLQWNENSWTSSYGGTHDLVTRVYGTFFILALFYLYYSDRKSNRIASIKRYMENFIIIIGIMAIGTVGFKLGVFWRFEAVVGLFSPIIFVNMKSDKKQLSYYIKKLLYISSIFMSMINFVHLSINYYIGKLFMQMITDSPFIILLRNIVNVLKNYS